jgi:3',5'-cyclic AMP phosphodiesterase CpdA
VFFRRQMRIAHFSDPHAGGPPEDFIALFDKRIVGAFNYTFRRRFTQDFKSLRLAAEKILELKPDLIVCTGDITSTGQPGEFKKVLGVLEPLIKSPVPMIFTPGNHDAYVRRKKCVTALGDAFATLNKNTLSLDRLPAVRTVGECDFVIVNESRPTHYFSSCGFFDKKTKSFLESLRGAPKPRPRALVGHFPLVHTGGILQLRHRLWGQKTALELLRDGVIDLSLCGHAHRHYTDVDSSGRGECSAGSVTMFGKISLVEYDRKQNIFTHKSIPVR